MFWSAGCSLFLVIKTLDLEWIRIRIGIQPKMLGPDPDPGQMSTDPQPWYTVYLVVGNFRINVRWRIRISISVVDPDPVGP
jgi:hypothetical protein